MLKARNKTNFKIKSSILGMFVVSIFILGFAGNNNQPQTDFDDHGQIYTSAPAIEETFDSYTIGSNINGQGNWLALSDAGCTATVQTIAAADRWLRLTDGNGNNLKVEAFWNFTVAAPKTGNIKFDFQTDSPAKVTTMMICDSPYSEINPMIGPNGAAEMRVNGGNFEAHDGTGNTWVVMRAAVASTTYNVEIHYKIGTGWHAIINGVMYGGEFKYKFSFLGNPATMRLFEVTTSRANTDQSYNSFFDNIDISWTPNIRAPTLTQGSVTPSDGANKTTSFVFSVNYTDADNNPPQYVNVTIDASTVCPMTKQIVTDNDYTNGCIYQYSMYLPIGNHSYFFNASDGVNLVGAGPFYGPIAEPSWNEVPLPGIRIGCVVAHGETNPLIHYKATTSVLNDLTRRGAVFSNITIPITSAVLANYDIIWVDEGGSYMQQSELTAIDQWLINGGRIITTGNNPNNGVYSLGSKFGIGVYSTSGSISGSLCTIYSHPITRGIPSGSGSIYFNLNPICYISINNQPRAILCVTISSYNVVYAMEYGKGKYVAISDDNVFHNITMVTYNRLFANNTFGWLGYVMVNNNAPRLTKASVAPASGSQNTPFTFSVMYTDRDNNPPAYVRATINGTVFPMTMKNPYDLNFTDGCIYQVTMYCMPRTVQYSFTCSDGKFINTTATYTNLTVNELSLVVPTLNSPSVFPFRGYNATTMFNFSVVYADGDNNAPSYVNLVLNSTTYAMHKNNPLDTNFMDGCLYVLRMRINVTGNYSCAINTSDGFTPITTGPLGNLEIEHYLPIYFNGMRYDWNGYFNWTGMSEQGSDSFSRVSPVVFDISSTPKNSINGDRTVNATSRVLNNTNSFGWGTHEWTRIYIDIDLGSKVPLSIASPWGGGMDQSFTVTGDTYFVAMNRAFKCWILQSSEGSIAYLDKFSGILVNGTFYPQTNLKYSFQVRGTNVMLDANGVAPALTGESVSPSGGSQALLFTFNVTYSDADDNAPASINVYINGVAHAMQRQNPADLNMVDGCYFVYQTYLQPGTYQYFMNCTDGLHSASTPIHGGLNVGFGNLMPPSVNLGMVSPKSGYNGSTPFTFRVIYQDFDNNAPVFVNITINGTTNAMTKVDPGDTNYKDGSTYTFTTRLAIPGKYNYQFSTSDGGGTITDAMHSDLKVSLTNVMFLDDMYWEWDGYFKQNGGLFPRRWMHGRETFNQTDAQNFTVMSIPNMFPFTPGRNVDGIGGKILMGSYPTGSLEWVKIRTNIGIGTRLPIGVYDTWGTPEDFVVTGETVFVAMNRSFACWVLEAASGHVAYYDKYSGILINGTYVVFMGGMQGFSLQISATSYPLQSNAVAPVLSASGVTPASGNQTTPFQFHITYTDKDNNLPEYVNLVVDGTTFAMMKQNPADENYVDGCVYITTIYLQPGSHNYHFACSDWLYASSTSNAVLNVATAGNTHAPLLNNGQVIPIIGYNGTTMFQFIVDYIDADNNAPTYVQVTINGTTHAMAKQNASDTGFIDGCAYIKTLVINSTGSYTYQFSCSDGTFPVTTPAYNDLVVTSKPNLYFNGMVYNWTCYVDWNRASQFTSTSFNLVSGVKYFLNSTPDGPWLWSDRYVFDIARAITTPQMSQFLPDSHDWVRVYRDIGLGRTLPLSIWQEGDQLFTVTGESFFWAMGRTFNCWYMESSSGSYAYYDKFSGLLVFGYFITAGMGGPGSKSYYTIMINGTNVPLAPNTHAPVLSSHLVIPASGNQNMMFNFSIVYTDADGDVPRIVEVLVNGTSHSMTQVDASDMDYSDGATFQYLTYLSPGRYNYSYTCKDYMFSASTVVYIWIIVTSSNAFNPTLQTPAVSPTRGMNTTVFNFTVIYSDADNNLPSYVQVTIDASTYTMIPVNPGDLNVMDGKLYSYTRTLMYGTHQFRFACSDGTKTNVTTWKTGPEVNPLMSFINITLFFDDFEHGLSNWTTTSGLWHLTDTSSTWIDPCHSPIHSMWFGRELHGTYNTGERSQGDLISVPFDLSITKTAYLQFYHWRAADFGSDQSFVYITTNGGTTWHQLYLSSVQSILPWQRVVINVSQYCGNASVQIRFTFDTQNGWDNNYRGWLVDDVLVFSNMTKAKPVADFSANITTILQYRWVQFNYTGTDGNPPASFQWNFNDGSPLSIERNPRHQFNTSSSFTISLLVTDFDGDTSSITKINYILVNPNLLPSANFTANATSIGIGQYVLFTFTGSTGDLPATYEWYFGDGSSNSSVQNPPAHRYTTLGNFTVSLKVIDSNGDASFLRKIAFIRTIDYIPTANFIANATQAHINDTIQFTFTGTDGNVPLAFQWYFGDGKANSTVRNPIHKFGVVGNYTVTLLVTDFDGDTALMKRVNYIAIVIELTPIANFTSNCTTIYKGQWVLFAFTGFKGDAPAMFNWSFGDGTSNSTLENPPAHKYNTQANFTVTLWIKDADGDVNILKVIDYISVINRHPVANFTTNATTIRVGMDVLFTFTGSEGDPPAYYNWSFGDSPINSTLRNPVHRYNAIGNFTVTLQVRDSDGDADTKISVKCIIVVANLFPVSNFTANATRINLNGWVLFTFTGYPGDLPAAFNWSFGDGTSNATTQNPVHQFTSLGNFTIILTVRDLDGDKSVLKRINYIHIILKPVANFIANCTSIGRERWVQFNYTGTDGDPLPVTFQWSFGDGTANSTARNPKHMFMNLGDYIIKVRVRDGDGDVDMKIMINFIHVINLIPVANFMMNVTNPIYEGARVQFTFIGSEGDSPALFAWDFGDGGNSSARNPAHQYMTEGNFPVTLTLLDRYLEFTYVVRANFVHVVKDITPAANFQANITSIIVGGSVKFTFTGSSGNTPARFLWNFGDGAVNSTDKDPVHVFSAVGVYSITLTVIDYDNDTNVIVLSNFITVSLKPATGGFQPILDYLMANWWIPLAGLVGIVAIIGGVVAARKKAKIAKAKIADTKAKKADGYRTLEQPAKLLTHEQVIAKLQHLFVFHRASSVCMMYMPFTEKHFDPQLIAGFLSAITTFGGTFDEKAKLHVLDYQGFKIIMEESEYCRFALLVQGELDEQINDLLHQFIIEFESKYEAELAVFKGDITAFEDSNTIIAKIFGISGKSIVSEMTTKACPAVEQAPHVRPQQHLYCGTCQQWSDITPGHVVSGTEKCATCDQPLYIVLECTKCGNRVVRYSSEFDLLNKNPPRCDKCGNAMIVQ